MNRLRKLTFPKPRPDAIAFSSSGGSRLSTILLAAIFVVILLALPLKTHAQGPPIEAFLDKDQLSSDELVTLTVVINAEDGVPSEPEAPPLQGFAVIARSTSTAVTASTGQNTTTQIIYEYTLKPTMVGYLTVPPIKVTIGGQEYASEYLPIKVIHGSRPPEAAPPAGLINEESQPDLKELIFVTADVDNPNPYVGQQIVYNFRIFKPVGAASIYRISYPDFDGFWDTQDPMETEGEVVFDGQAYQVITGQTILFPTTAGPVTIGPAALNLTKTIFQAVDDPLSEAVELDVKPLPADAPPDFQGTVGNFSISAQVDLTETRVNEPLSLLVTLKGEGNIDILPAPTLPAMPAWRVFDNPPQVNTIMVQGKLRGSRTYPWILVPNQAGDLTIPPISYSFFDPEAEVYRTIATDPIPITVASGATEPPVPQLNVPQKVEKIASDIRHIKEAPTVLQRTGQPLAYQYSYWFAWLLPLLALGIYLMGERRQAWLQANPIGQRQKQAYKAAQQGLSQARQKQTDPYQATGQILLTYLTDRTGQTVAGLTRQALHLWLLNVGLDVAQVERTEQLLTTSEMGRFSPQALAAPHQDLLATTEQLIADLEADFKLIQETNRQGAIHNQSI